MRGAGGWIGGEPQQCLEMEHICKHCTKLQSFGLSYTIGNDHNNIVESIAGR